VSPDEWEKIAQNIFSNLYRYLYFPVKKVSQIFGLPISAIKKLPKSPNMVTLPRGEFLKWIFAPTEKLVPTDKLARCYSWRLRAKLAPMRELAPTAFFKNSPLRPYLKKCKTCAPFSRGVRAGQNAKPKTLTYHWLHTYVHVLDVSGFGL
jgi:hypothetical protein